MPVCGAANSVFNRVETHHTVNVLVLCETLKTEMVLRFVGALLGVWGIIPLV